MLKFKKTYSLHRVLGVLLINKRQIKKGNYTKPLNYSAEATSLWPRMFVSCIGKFSEIKLGILFFLNLLFNSKLSILLMCHQQVNYDVVVVLYHCMMAIKST